MKQRKKILIIAGSDSSGLAGIQRDNQTVQALGCHPLNVVTACTAQNASGVVNVNPCSEEVFANQLRAIDTEGIGAIKIGLVCNASQIKSIAAFLQQLKQKPPVVIDPVAVASSGEAMQSREASQALISQLLPLCDVLTPNLSEATVLSGLTVNKLSEMEVAARALCQLGPKHVLLKGGHCQEAGWSHDFFCAQQALPSAGLKPGANAESSFWLSSETIVTENTRGTGCTLASAIACSLALGYSMHDAQVIGKMTINQGLHGAYGLVNQAGPVYVKGFPAKQTELPRLSFGIPKKVSGERFPAPSLPNGISTPLGFYPVVDSLQWLQRLLPLGVSTIQLRIKNSDARELSLVIEQAVALAKQYNSRLFINDHWHLAIEHGAYGVHLGQEDLCEADIEKIRQAGLRLGVSTHCHYEVARALACQPSYIAYGPVYHTATKDMPWIPQGSAGFSYWRELLDYPMVAIGGIKRRHIPDLLAKGADGIAMITAITEAERPEETAQDFMALINKNQKRQGE